MKFEKRLFLAQVLPTVVLTLIFLAITGELIPALAFGTFIFIMLVAGSQVTGKVNIRKAKGKYPFISEESIFNNSILVLLAAVLRADDKKNLLEYKYIEAALGEHFSKERVDRMVDLIEKLTKSDNLNIYAVCNVVESNFRLHERIQLMHFLVGIVTADGVLMDKERAILLDIAQNIALPHKMVASVLKMFNYITEQELKNRQERNKRKNTRISMSLKRAYEILGIAETATVKEIKKRYRKLAMKHHPDRLIQLGEEHQKSAKEKFQAISDAYEYIKERKGFS